MKIESQFSSFACKRLAKITLSLSFGAAFGIISSFGQSTLAQSVNFQSPQGSDGYQSNEKDPGDNSLGNFDPFQLIHNANLGATRTAEEFNSDTERNIKDAAAEFKRLQQERMLNQQSGSPANPLPENDAAQ